VIGDVRFSPEVAGLQPFWGIRVDWEQPDRAVQKLRFGFSLKHALRNLWQNFRGTYPASIRINGSNVPPATTQPP
jgi:hypothetical protein